MIKTVSLTADTETKVEISGGYNVGVINRTTGMLYASRKSGVVAGADDVAAIPAGDSYVIRAADDTVYLLATAAGDVQLESIGAKEVFKIAATRTSSGGGEGGTVDDVARQAISSHAGNAEIHVTSEERAAWNGKAELADIPTALPANGGNANTVDGYHAWELQAVGSDGAPFGHTITANHQADDGRFKFTVNDPSLKTSVDYAYNADTLDGFHAQSFLKTNATTKLTASINATNIAADTYSGEASYTPDFPTGFGNYGLIDVRIYGVIIYQTIYFDTGVVIYRSRVVGATDWTAWRSLSDGGNAATLNDHSDVDFVLKSEYDALAARVAALESKN